jgi:hypothetical protein
MVEEIEILQNYNLVRLQNYLNYEISGAILFFLAFAFFGFIFIASAAAIIFTPFMLYVLFQENRKSWIIIFVIIVGIPVLLLLISSLTSEFNRILLLLSLGLFYLYCFLLRLEVNNWVQEDMAKRQYIIEKKARDEELKSFMTNYENKM